MNTPPPNTYQARSVNRKKEILSEKYAFPFLRPTNEALRLNFNWQLGRILGVRLNTYTDSVE